VSLCGDMELHYGPEMEDYERRARIPEDQWCTGCEGLGSWRVQHSDFGPTQGKDYRRCFLCQGTGRKPNEK
jgi:hypothetical protein